MSNWLANKFKKEARRGLETGEKQARQGEAGTEGTANDRVRTSNLLFLPTPHDRMINWVGSFGTVSYSYA